MIQLRNMNKRKARFEGWYFKHVSKNKKYSLSFIIGISKSNKEEVS